MEVLVMMALAWALGGGITAGHATAQQHSKSPKAPKPIDRTESGKRVAQGAINSVARIYTWTSGAKEGWRKAWPETKTAIAERRAKVKAERSGRAATAGPATAPPAPTAPTAAKGEKGEKGAPTGTVAPDEPEIVDAEIVEDEPLNTAGPTAPSADRIAEAEAAAAAASADATVRVHVVTDPTPPAATTGGGRPVPPGPAAAPVPAPRPGPAAAGTVAAGTVAPDELPDWLFDDDPTGAAAAPAVPAAAGPGLHLVKDPPPAPTPAPTPGPATGGTATPRSSMTNLPTASAGAATVEVNGVDSLQLWLRQMHGWAQLEMEDAQAALTRITDLQAKAEAAYAAAASAKYDPATLGELAAIVDQLGLLKATREKDLHSSELAAHNASISEGNVQTRHGAINEAVAAAPVEMAESTTYGD
ncbi:hypothetical protein ACFVZ3_07960 [Kitasatospora purpeofusca]|uniref:hypothetical protein n=1 Tax=Kitasatospora purpeofusca TaxID=67352 RepID=UPI0036817B19